MTMIMNKQAVKQQDVRDTAFANLPLYEQRYLPRWDVSSNAYYHLPGTHQIFKTQTRNISLTGVCLYVSPDIHLNEKVELKIYLSPKENFEVNGTAIGKYTLFGHGCYAGFFFDHLPQEKQELILRYAFEFSKNQQDQNRA